MGQIVFQATLGGQTALVGQNTASSYSLTLPLATDTLVGKATTDTLTNKTLTSPTINGATLTTSAFNGTIGATTPSTAVVTSLTDSGLTSGRVTYATTGGLLTDSANMTFDGSTLTTLNSAYTGTLTGGTGVVNLGSGQLYKDASGNVGIGTSSPSSFGKFAVISTGVPTTAYASILSGAGTYNGGFESTLYIGSSRTDILNNGSIAGYRLKTLSPDAGGAYLAFEAASSSPTSSSPPTTFTERMRIDSSGNVIIGGTSPLNSGSGRGSLSVNGTTDSIVAWGIGGAAKSYIYNASDHFEITTQGSYYMSFQTANTERMRIDSSGNVGIGVTPNAQSIGGPALQFYGGLQICGNNSRSYIDANAYWNGSNWIRIAALPACQQVNDQNSGTFTWNSTATGAAGSTIGWTGILSIGKDVTVALQGANLNSGTGISFPATQNASSDANTLDDYEKGTWTPTLTGTTPATGVTYSSQQGTYTKIGNIVYIRCTVQTSNKGTGGGGVACIGGIPFSATGLSGGYAYQSNIIYYYTSTGISGSISGTIYDNGNTIQFSNPFNATNTVASSVLANIERISFNMVYQVS